MSGHAWILAVAACALAGILIAIVVIDFRRLIIPDALNLALAVAGLAFQFAAHREGVTLQIGSAAITLCVLWAVRYGHFQMTGRIGLGLGDVKMLGACALWIHPLLMPVLLLIASATALLFIGWQAVAIGSMATRARVPFGPFIALGLGLSWAVEQVVGLNLEML